MTGPPGPRDTEGMHEATTYTQRKQTSSVLLGGYLEGLPLNLPSSSDSLGLDEEGARVDQLHALESLTCCSIQVLTLSHLGNLGLSVRRQLQDRLRDSSATGGRDLQS